MKIRVGDALKTFVAMSMMFNIRSVSLGVKRDFYEGGVVATVTYAVETWGMRMDERHKLNFMKTRSLLSMCGVTSVDKRNDEARLRPGVRENKSDRVHTRL